MPHTVVALNVCSQIPSYNNCSGCTKSRMPENKKRKLGEAEPVSADASSGSSKSVKTGHESDVHSQSVTNKTKQLAVGGTVVDKRHSASPVKKPTKSSWTSKDSKSSGDSKLDEKNKKCKAVKANKSSGVASHKPCQTKQAKLASACSSQESSKEVHKFEPAAGVGGGKTESGKDQVSKTARKPRCTTKSAAKKSATNKPTKASSSKGESATGKTAKKPCAMQKSRLIKNMEKMSIADSAGPKKKLSKNVGSEKNPAASVSQQQQVKVSPKLQGDTEQQQPATKPSKARKVLPVKLLHAGQGSKRKAPSATGGPQLKKKLKKQNKTEDGDEVAAAAPTKRTAKATKASASKIKCHIPVTGGDAANKGGYRFWRCPRSRRMASLNAQAKVHVLYENEARGLSPEENSGTGSEEESGLSRSQTTPAVQAAVPLTGANVVKPEIGKKMLVAKAKKLAQQSKQRGKRVLGRPKGKKQEARKSGEDAVLAVVPKRMASLNAQAILAASYSLERARPKAVKSFTKVMSPTPPSPSASVAERHAIHETSTTQITINQSLIHEADNLTKVIDSVASRGLKYCKNSWKAEETTTIKAKKLTVVSKKSKGATKVKTATAATSVISSASFKNTVTVTTSNKLAKIVTSSNSAKASTVTTSKKASRKRLCAIECAARSPDPLRSRQTEDIYEFSEGLKEGEVDDLKLNFCTGDDTCDPAKAMDITEVVLTTAAELQPSEKKIAVKTEAIRRGDKIEDTAEVTITGMYINPVTNTSQSFCISRIHTYKQASATGHSYSPSPAGVTLGGPQPQAISANAAAAAASAVIPPPLPPPPQQQPPQQNVGPQSGRHLMTGVSGAGLLHAGHVATVASAAHLHSGASAAIYPYPSAATAQPCGMGGVPIVDVALSRHYGSAFTVPHYGHHNALSYGYYQPAGPLIQTLGDPCLIHKPVPFHPHPFPTDRRQSHAPPGPQILQQSFPAADQCHARPSPPYPPPGPGPGGQQQLQQPQQQQPPQPQQQPQPQSLYGPSGADGNGPAPSAVSAGGAPSNPSAACGIHHPPSAPSANDKCQPSPANGAISAAPSQELYFGDGGCQSCAAAAAAAVAAAVAAEQYSSSPAHYSRPSGTPAPASAPPPPPSSTPSGAVTTSAHEFSARARGRLSTTIGDGGGDPYGRFPPTKPDVGRQNALPIQTKTATSVFSPPSVKIETVESSTSSSSSDTSSDSEEDKDRKKSRNGGGLKGHCYPRRTSLHHMATRRVMKTNSYGPMPPNAMAKSGSLSSSTLIESMESHKVNGGGREMRNSTSVKNNRNRQHSQQPRPVTDGPGANNATNKKNLVGERKLQLRPREAKVALAVEDVFKKSAAVNSWLSTSHPRKEEAASKVMCTRRSSASPTLNTNTSTLHVTRQKTMELKRIQQQQQQNGRINGTKPKVGTFTGRYKESLIQTRRSTDAASQKPKLGMRDVTNERLRYVHPRYADQNQRTERLQTPNNSHSHHSGSNSRTLMLPSQSKGYASPARHGGLFLHKDSSSSNHRSSSSSSNSSSSSVVSLCTDSVMAMQPRLILEHIPRPLLRSKLLKVPRYSNGWTWEGAAFQQVVYVHNDDPPFVRTCYPAMRHVEGDIIRARDCVLLKSGPRRNDLPFVAKIAALWENPEDGEMMLSLLWYYRPEHTEQGRKPHHMEDEIFASKHRDVNSVACIEDKCYVLTYNEYCRHRRRNRILEEGVKPKPSVVADLEEGYPRNERQPPCRISPEMTFFCRRVYDFRQKRILKNPT